MENREMVSPDRVELRDYTRELLEVREEDMVAQRETDWHTVSIEALPASNVSPTSLPSS